MLKKYFIYCLILSVIHFISCTSLEVISEDDVITGEKDIDIHDELFVVTKDFTKYHFLAHNYQIVNDTLYGRGTVERDSMINVFKGSIPLQNVMNFEQNRTDAGKTIFLFTGVILIGIITLAIMVLSDIPKFNSD